MKVKITFEADRDKYPDRKWKRLEREIDRYMQGELARNVKRDFKESVVGWEHPPEFMVRFDAVRYTLEVYPVGPYAIQYQRVSEGVKGHFIYPRSGGMLAFQPGYSPHTKPGGKWGGPGRRSGETVYAKVVNWPGIQARNFDDCIKERNESSYERTFVRLTERYMR